jgi:hypothetical protein
MEWEFLTRAPRVGDVLFYEKNNLIVLVVRKYVEDGNHSLVDVLWLESLNGSEHEISAHYGVFSSWKGWMRLT